jgi:hypothetical protein
MPGTRLLASYWNTIVGGFCESWRAAERHGVACVRVLLDLSTSAASTGEAALVLVYASTGKPCLLILKVIVSLKGQDYLQRKSPLRPSSNGCKGNLPTRALVASQAQAALT